MRVTPKIMPPILWPMTAEAESSCHYINKPIAFCLLFLSVVTGQQSGKMESDMKIHTKLEKIAECLWRPNSVCHHSYVNDNVLQHWQQ